MDGPKELSQLFNNPFLSDIRIKQISTSGEIREYCAHKVVLCMESQYFMNAFKGGFKEASDSVIELHDDDPYYFEIVLKSIYSPGYHATVYDRTLDSPKEKVLAQIGTYIIADKYLVTLCLS
ncbi:hypothetical protein C7974DRAFT_376891 [Boeremia exigua]|uniref:uncharacterized protein n=1 Tax=Boeremia exigua TaxID=749465 RepID=UPI001E8ED037|nr:uncharacterized protein C7974DRAFT_376891 [Boeremia exigua]KAH6625362.1 hypothetical protein C7974DRAFT_376891 [Boeremia exigua]